MKGLRLAPTGQKAAFLCAVFALLLPTQGHAAEPSSFPNGPWQSQILKDHPLVGQVWDSSAGRWIPFLTLSYRLSNADWVLLGEQHDNPDHHTVQASVLAALLAAGRKPGLAVEMVEPAQQDILDHAAKYTTRGPEMGTALRWEQRGWPQWSWYQPIFAQALAAGLPMVAANLDRSALLAVARDTAMEIAPAIAEQQTIAVVAGHCGLVPAEQARPMVQVQVARDQAMARALILADQRSQDGAILIAGAGHVRRDVAVPAFLPPQSSSGKTAVSVAMVEVQADETNPQAYDADRYDYVLFTPQAARPDPCEALKRRFSSSQKKD